MRRVTVASLAGLVALAVWLPAASLAQTPPAAGDPAYRAGGLVLGASPAGRTPAPPQAQPEPSGTLHVPELRLTTQIAFGRAVDSVTTFKPDQPAIFAWLRHAGAQPGAALTGRLVFLAPAEEIEAMTATARLEKGDDTAHFKFASPAEGWPEGRYRLDLVSGGVTVRTQEFQVRRAR